MDVSTNYPRASLPLASSCRQTYGTCNAELADLVTRLVTSAIETSKFVPVKEAFVKLSSTTPFQVVRSLATRITHHAAKAAALCGILEYYKTAS